MRSEIYFLLVGSASALVNVRVLDRAEARAASSKICELCASAILGAEERSDKVLLANALRNDLMRKLAVGSSSVAVLLAEDEESEMVGCAAIETALLTPQAIPESKLGKIPAIEAGAEQRPLLSSVAVDPRYRRKGLGKRLCKEAEAVAATWGYDEILLKVEADNRRARNLYRKMGYRKVYLDKDAEKPEASPGGVKFVQTVQIALRKSLRYPPLDTLVVSAAGLVAAAAIYATNADLLQQAAGLLLDGEIAEAAELLASLLPSELLARLPSP